MVNGIHVLWESSADEVIVVEKLEECWGESCENLNTTEKTAYVLQNTLEYTYMCTQDTYMGGIIVWS